MHYVKMAPSVILKLLYKTVDSEMGRKCLGRCKEFHCGIRVQADKLFVGSYKSVV